MAGEDRAVEETGDGMAGREKGSSGSGRGGAVRCRPRKRLDCRRTESC